MVITIVLPQFLISQKQLRRNVATFHEASLEIITLFYFLTEPIFPLRRGTVSKECIHIALGITPEGQKAVLGCRNRSK